MVNIISTFKTGSCAVTKYISSIMKIPNRTIAESKFKLENDTINRIILGYSIDNNYLLESIENIINNYKQVVLLDRVDKTQQAKEFVDTKKTNYFKIDTKYNDLDSDLIREYIIQFTEQSHVLKRISNKYSIPIFYYEDLFYNNGLNKLCNFLDIEEDKIQKQKYFSLDKNNTNINFYNTEKINIIKESLI